MTTKTIPLTAVSIQSSRPDSRYGLTASMPISSVARMMFQASLAGIPSTATVTSALVQVTNNTATAGSQTWSVRPNTSAWSTSVSWTTRPTNSTPQTDVTKTSPAVGAVWEFDITATVQAWVSGSLKNYGMGLFSLSTANGGARGTNAASGAPVLVISYTVAPTTPSGLHPSSGAVSIAKPTLTFQVAADTVSVQVQVDPSANSTTPAFDSGEVASTAGLLDLSTFSSPRAATISTTSGSTTITAGVSTFTYLDVGQAIAGTGIPGGATITGVASGTSATISANATATGSPSATITRTYLGLSNGSSTQWRCRAKNGQGWSAWSAWVSFPRTNWGTLSITSPTSTSEDPSPVVGWTYSGTQTAWRAYTTDANGKVVSDSQWTGGTDTSWASGVSVGAAGRAYVRLRDNIYREATPGDPDYLTAMLPFTVAASGTPSTMTTLSASTASPSPYVTVTGSRSAGIPDQVAVYRNGAQLFVANGADLFSGTAFTWVDRTAPMNVSGTYVVKCIVNGHWSNDGPTAVVTPRCTGIWLIDPTDNSQAVIWGNDDQDQAQPEIAVVHTPVSGDAAVVRRRLSRQPRQGTLSGILADSSFAAAPTASASQTALEGWATQDAGHTYRLVLGNRNDPVILGNIELSETPDNGVTNGRVLDVSLDWWATS